MPRLQLSRANSMRDDVGARSVFTCSIALLSITLQFLDCDHTPYAELSGGFNRDSRASSDPLTSVDYDAPWSWSRVVLDRVSDQE